MEIPKGILPAARTMKDFEALLASDSEYIVLLEVRISQLKAIMRYANRANKKVIIHADLIQGLKSDEYAIEFLCRELQPFAIMSTRATVITNVKKNNIVAIQRLFLLDSNALDHNFKIIKKTQPDYLEVLPGLIPHMIEEIRATLGIPVIAGGLIRTKEDVDQALDAGAIAVTTSRRNLWNF